MCVYRSCVVMCVCRSCVAEQRYTWQNRICPSILIHPSCLCLANVKAQVLKSLVAQHIHICAFRCRTVEMLDSLYTCILPPFSYMITQYIANCYNPTKYYIKLHSLKNLDTST